MTGVISAIWGLGTIHLIGFAMDPLALVIPFFTSGIITDAVGMLVIPLVPVVILHMRMAGGLIGVTGAANEEILKNDILMNAHSEMGLLPALLVIIRPKFIINSRRIEAAPTTAVAASS